MEKWIFDSSDQAGEAFRQFIKDCYQKNLLIKNEMKLDGKNINLKNIKPRKRSAPGSRHG